MIPEWFFYFLATAIALWLIAAVAGVVVVWRGWRRQQVQLNDLARQRAAQRPGEILARAARESPGAIAETRSITRQVIREINQDQRLAQTLQRALGNAK